MANVKHTIDTAAIGTTELPGVSGQMIEHQVEQIIAAGAGDVYERGRFAYSGAVAVELRSRALATLLGQLELTARTPCINFADTGKSLICTFAKEQTGGDGRAGAGSHISYTFAKGWGYLGNIGSAEGNTAMATLIGLPCSSDGAVANTPYTRSAAASLQDLPTSREIYRLSAVTVGGTTQHRWRDWSLDFEAAAQPLRPSHAFWPTEVLFGGPGGLITQRLSLGTEEIDALWTAAGGVGAETTIVLTLKELDTDGTYGSGQITITLIGSLQPANARGEAQGEAEGAYEFVTRFDGTNSPCTIVVA